MKDLPVGQDRPKAQDAIELGYTTHNNAQIIDTDGYSRRIATPTKSGKLSKLSDDRDVFAIQKNTPHLTQYFIKVSENGEVFDPLDTEHINTRQRKVDGVEYWRWSTTTKNGFKSYIDYLKYKDKGLLTRARSEYYNKQRV